MKQPDGVWEVDSLVKPSETSGQKWVHSKDDQMSFLAERPSNSDNAPRPPGTFAGEVNRALDEAMTEDPNVLVCGQLVKYGVAGMTTGLYEKHQDQFVTFSVSESLMNSAAMGFALAGKRPVMIHVRIDFLASGMCALVNHIPVWYAKGFKLPLVILCQIGKGMGQGPQHSKDLTPWFRMFDGWTVCVPETPTEAYEQLKASIFGDRPVLYAIHRELFNAPAGKRLTVPDRIRLCGTSQRHERAFYGE